jgi:hypothetical protein
MSSFPPTLSALLKMPAPIFCKNDSEEEKERYSRELNCENLKAHIFAIQSGLDKKQTMPKGAWRKFMQTPYYKKLLNEKFKRAGITPEVLERWRSNHLQATGSQSQLK